MFIHRRASGHEITIHISWLRIDLIRVLLFIPHLPPRLPAASGPSPIPWWAPRALLAQRELASSSLAQPHCPLHHLPPQHPLLPLPGLSSPLTVIPDSLTSSPGSNLRSPQPVPPRKLSLHHDLATDGQLSRHHYLLLVLLLLIFSVYASSP